MKIVNLTQHWATPEQKDAGVFDLPLDQHNELVNLLTFDSKPDYIRLTNTADAITLIARKVLGFDRGNMDCYAMIGGAPYLMSHLERSLRNQIICPIYAFSKRVSVEETQPDGTVKKIAVFRHEGFVRGCHHE